MFVARAQQNIKGAVVIAARGESALESEDEQNGRVRGGATKQYPQRYERVAPTKKSAILLVRSPNDFRHGLIGP
jgi:hypothetical protein